MRELIELIHTRDKNLKLEIDTSQDDKVFLAITFMTDEPDEIELSREQVLKLAQQLGAWLGGQGAAEK